MRIAVVHSYYSDRQPSGENLVVDRQSEALTAAGHDVRLFARRTDDTSGAEAFYRVRCACRVSLGAGWNPLPGIREFRPDVVHVHNTFPNMGTNWLKRLDVPLVVTIHNFRFECAAGTLFRDGAACHQCLHVPVLPAIAHSCYRGRPESIPPALATAPRIGAFARGLGAADAVICLSALAAEHVTRRLGPQRPVVRVLPNFAPDVADAPRGGDVPPVDALYVGRLSQEKGICRAVREWPAGRTLTVVGDGPEAPSIERLADSNPDIRFLGPATAQRIRQLMRAARVLVVPSLCYEGFPTVVLEAMQLGLPLLLSDTVAIARSLEDRGAAVVFSFRGGGLAAGLSVTAEQEPRLRHRSREAYEQHFSKQAWLRAIDSIYVSAVEHRSGRS